MLKIRGRNIEIFIIIHTIKKYTVLLVLFHGTGTQ